MGNSAVKKSLSARVEENLFEITLDANEGGAADSLRRKVLTWVLESQYDRAIEALREYIASDFQYPGLKDKILRFANHSIDLIFAIRAKRGFPGIHSLTRSKQVELREKFVEHFKELQHVLKCIEKIEQDVRIGDVRSTVYVVKAAWLAGLAIVVTAFWIEIVTGLAHTSSVILDDGLVKFAAWICNLIGL